MDADFQGLVDVQAAAIVDVGGEWDDADVAKPPKKIKKYLLGDVLGHGEYAV